MWRWARRQRGSGGGGSARGQPPPTAGKNPKLSHYYVPVFSSTPKSSGAGRCRMPGAVSDQVLGRSTGWARLGSPVDGGGRVRNPRRPSSRGSSVLPQLNPTRITRLPSCAPAPRRPLRPPGAECPAARRWRRQRLARQVGSGVTLGRAARAVQPTGETMADAMTVALKERLDAAHHLASRIAARAIPMARSWSVS